MGKYAYGHQPSDLPAERLALGWLRGIRHLKSVAATGSFWHSHREIQLLYCIKGEFTYEFRDQPPTVLTAGHFIVIPTGLEHRHLKAVDPAGHRVELLLQTPDGRDTPAYGLLPPALTAELLAALGDRACTSVACSRELQSCFAELDTLAVRGQDISEAELALVRTLASLVLQRCALQPRIPAARGEVRLMDEVLAWLEAHFTEPLRIDRLVAYTGYSRARLFSLFKEHTGLSPADWITRRRIGMACDLLERTSMTSGEIAGACGFASAQYFNSVFRKRTGHTPTAWRRRS